MSDRDFAAFLEASLTTLEQDAPRAVQRLRASLGPRRIAFEVDGTRTVLCCTVDAFSLERAGSDGPGADVALEISRPTVVQLVEGRLTLRDAIARGDMDLRGPVSDLGNFFDALHAYLAGAVRSPFFPHLFEAYRREKKPPEPGECDA